MAHAKTELHPTPEQLLKLRERLQAMSRRELQEFGRIARRKCVKRSSAKVWDIVELEEATQEWQRREKSKTVRAASPDSSS